MKSAPFNFLDPKAWPLGVMFSFGRPAGVITRVPSHSASPRGDQLAVANGGRMSSLGVSSLSLAGRPKARMPSDRPASSRPAATGESSKPTS